MNASYLVTAVTLSIYLEKNRYDGGWGPRDKIAYGCSRLFGFVQSFLMSRAKRGWGTSGVGVAADGYRDFLWGAGVMKMSWG